MGTPLPRLEAPQIHSRLFTSLPFGDAQHWWAAPVDRCSLAWICAPQFHSALLHYHHHCPCPPCTPHQALLLFWCCISFPRKFIIFPFKLHFDSSLGNLSIPTLLISQIEPNDVWIQFRPLTRPRLFGNTRSASSFFYAIDELCVPAFVGPDEMGDLVDDIETMFDWYHSIT